VGAHAWRTGNLAQKGGRLPGSTPCKPCARVVGYQSAAQLHARRGGAYLQRVAGRAMSQRNMEVIRQVFEAWEEGDLTRLKAGLQDALARTSRCAPSSSIGSTWR